MRPQLHQMNPWSSLPGGIGPCPHAEWKTAEAGQVTVTECEVGRSQGKPHTIMNWLVMRQATWQQCQ